MIYDLPLDNLTLINKMNILFATNHTYLPQFAGGSESSTNDLCLHLQRLKLKVAVLSGLEASGVIGFYNRLARKIFTGNQFPVDTFMGYPVFRGWQPLKGVNEIISKFDPSIAIIQAGRPVPLAEAFLTANIPTVIYLRDVEFDKMGGPPPVHSRLCYIANSMFTASKAKAALGLDPIVIPPLVRPEKYLTITKRRKVIFINPHPVKGAEIAFRLAESRPDIPFEFVESWPLPDKLLDEYRRRAIQLGNVNWRKPVLNMKKIYCEAKIILAPSLWEEAWGRIATEAHINGIPVLASNRGGLPESVGPGGILIDPSADFLLWQKALSRLWDHPEEYNAFSKAALSYSKRPEIQPEILIRKFLNALTDHYSRCKPSI